MIDMFPWYTKKKKKKKDEEPSLFPRQAKAGAVKKGPDLVKKLDKVFSAYIRLRDVMPNGCFRCISCGQIKRIEQGDCGHFFSRVHMATRWDADNAHLECRGCNRCSADHLIKYRKNLIAKIGLDRINRLEMKADSTKHWMDFELKKLIDYYTKEVKRLSAEKGINLKI